MTSIKLMVVDARNDEYEEEFEVTNDSDGFPETFCGLCGNKMFSDSCSSGHIAITIIDENKDEKINDASESEVGSMPASQEE